MMVIGIDPGTTESGVAVVGHDYSVHAAEKLPNGQLRIFLRDIIASGEVSRVAIESIQSYGMAVGREVFETCFEIGRILELCEQLKVETELYPRPEIARSLCGCGKTNDTKVRQSLLLRFGGDKKGEPMHKLKGASDKRSAYAAAVYSIDLAGSKGR